MPYYLNPINSGLIKVSSAGDANKITLKWNAAYARHMGNHVGYNIYIDTVPPTFEVSFFNNSPAYVSTTGVLSADIVDLIPGQMYQFAVRAFEYNLFNFDFTQLPQLPNGLRVYPSSLLRTDIDADDVVIPLVDASEFPSFGTAKIGGELIRYNAVDYLANNLTGVERGINSDVAATSHTTNGLDGYGTLWDPAVLVFPILAEEQNTVVFETQNRFDVDHYAYTLVDGYRQITKDILTTDLSGSDAANVNFTPYTFSGYKRIDPVLLLQGNCMGSYFGGRKTLCDGYGNIIDELGGFSLQEANDQRQEILLDLTGEPVVLVKRIWTGIICKCMLPNQEHPDARCTTCYGTGFVVGYLQYFNPRRSDSRILVRFEPADDDLVMTDAGLESTLLPRCWTLVVPTVKDRDFLVRFDENGNEEFRYEILNVNRNKLLFSQSGAQHFQVQRVRKTDTIYNVKVFRDTSTTPVVIDSTINSAIPAMPPHKHSIVRNEGSPSGWEQLSTIEQGHNHTVAIDPNTGLLTLQEVLGHSHIIL